MSGQLTPEAIVALHVLKDKGQSNRQIARTLEVTESSIRYHLRRHNQPDGRQKRHAALVKEGCVLRRHNSGVQWGKSRPRTTKVEGTCFKDAHWRTIDRVIPWWDARQQSPPLFHPAEKPYHKVVSKQGSSQKQHQERRTAVGNVGRSGMGQGRQ